MERVHTRMCTTLSLVTELVLGKSLEDIVVLDNEFLHTILGIELGLIKNY